MFGGSGLSLADIAAVTNKDGNNDGFGGNNAWWVLIVLLALFNGNNGLGNNNNSRGGETVVVPVPGYGMGGMYGMSSSASFSDAAVQRGFDTQAIITKLDGLNSGICSLGYDQLSQMNGINQNIMQTGFGLQQGLNAINIAAMQNANALSTQFANCCCENRQGQAQIQFDMSQLGCSLQNTMNQNTRDLMEANNIGFRNLSEQIDHGFDRLTLSQKDAEIASLRQQLNDCNAQNLAQAAVRSAVEQIRPPAVPAYPASNPCGMGNWSPNVLANYGNGGCTCNNGWNGNCC